MAGMHPISLDMHKYGYDAKGSSVVMYRSNALRSGQYYVYAQWAGGLDAMNRPGRQ